MNTLRITLAGVCVLALCALTMSLAVEERYEEPICTGKPAVEWLPHPTNCSLYYVCRGDVHRKFTCGHARSWEAEQKVCVIKGSADDICTQNMSPSSCEYRLSGIIPHPVNCAQYYNCSYRTAGMYWENYLNECPYPLWFSMSSGRCEPYTQVDCGSRVEATNPCDYERNRCQRSHCIPCYVRYPDCAGMPDGDNLWKGKEESPYFCVCKHGRVIRDDCRCPSGHIFDPNDRECVYARNYFENKKTR